MADYADAAAGLVRALGARRVHVCGLSFGGGLALVVYQRHPDLVRSLVLAGAYAGWAGSLPPEVVTERIERVRSELERPPEEWVASYLPGFFSKPMPQETVEEVTAIMCDTRPAGAGPMLEAFARADLRHSLGDVRVPTLLLWGELDERAPLSIGRDLHERIPGSELVVLPAVGHMSNIEAPEGFNEEVRRFLQTVRN
jgi:pimeloyl-ACP methyl ester carboxylesterase